MRVRVCVYVPVVFGITIFSQCLHLFVASAWLVVEVWANISANVAVDVCVCFIVHAFRFISLCCFDGLCTCL